VVEGMLRLRSRPENSIAPYFGDTDMFPAENTRMAESTIARALLIQRS
jgi:hypothetical protein